jgi:DNA replication protein DnaC
MNNAPAADTAGLPSSEPVTPAPLIGEVPAALARLEAIVQRALLGALSESDRSWDPFRGLHLDAETIARLLSRAPGIPAFGNAPGLDPAIPDAAPDGSRLAQLALAYGLSDFDLDLLLIALGPDLDLRYERFYAYLQDDVTRRRPTVSLALDLLCESAESKLDRRAHFSSTAPLLEHRVIEWVDDPHHPCPSPLSASFKADEQIVRFLLGQGGIDSRLAQCARVTAPVPSLAAATVDKAVVRQLEAVIAHAIDANEPLTLAFHGANRSARVAAAHLVAATASRNLLTIDLAVAPDVGSLLPVAFREADLHNAVPILEHWDALADAAGTALGRLQMELSDYQGISVVSGERAWSSAPHGPKGVVAHHFGVPSFETRAACWREGLACVLPEPDEQLAQTLASRFRLNAAQIWDAVIVADHRAHARADRDGDRVPQAEDFFAAARQQSAHQLSAAATRIQSGATWADIVLPPDAIEQLRELCERVAYGHRVLGEWGFDARLSHGKGMTALFSGPSGTGKTMAAEVIANELGLDLYRVDIPSVVSKWIGETEKNLDRLFRLAENAILFFDEADALFGKRSEVRDAHDRYANVEISYLLQRIETFEGLAILATNVRHHLDEAFLRRLAFVVQFPFPDDEQRRRIWEGIWPAQTPLGPDLDFAHLARTFKFAGGNVKNIALAAAFTAAARGGVVTMSDVLHAVRREYQKLGKTLTDEELEIRGSAIEIGAGA